MPIGLQVLVFIICLLATGAVIQGIMQYLRGK